MQVHEEKVMMPLVVRIPEKPRTAYTNLVQPIDERHREGFEKFIAWVVKRLGRREKAATETRIFVHGLHVSSNEEQWARFLPIIMANTAPAIYADMVDNYFIESPGKQSGRQ